MIQPPPVISWYSGQSAGAHPAIVNTDEPLAGADVLFQAFPLGRGERPLTEIRQVLAAGVEYQGVVTPPSPPRRSGPKRLR